MSELTGVSLFAGVEGFGLALERSGVRVVASVEIDPDCRGVIARHFPETTLFDDVRTVTGDDLRAAGFVPGRGVVTGGFPCQDLSVAGRRIGLGGARSGLFWEIMRLADELSPQWLVLENVPGLLSAVCHCPGDDTCTDNGRAVRCGEWRGDGDQREWFPHVAHGVAGGACATGCMAAHGGAMGTVLGALGERGYGFAYRVLDSQFLGVPQRRERVFIVGCLGNRAAPVEVLLEPEGGQGHPAQGRAARQGAASGAPGRAGDACTVGTLGGSGPGGGWRVGSDEAAAGQLVTAPTITAGWGTNHGAPGHGGKDGAVLATMAATLQGGGRRGHRIDAEGAAGGHLIPFGTSAAITAHHGKGPDSDATNGLIIAPAVAATLTSGAHSKTTNAPGRHHEDQENLVAMPIAHALTSEGSDASEDGTGRGTPLVPYAPVPSSLAVAGDFSTGEDVAQTVRSAHGQPGCVAAGLAVRRLTPRECERLQAFPDDWTRWKLVKGVLVEQSDSARYRQIGNAVTTSVVEWIAHRIVAHEASRDAPADEAGAA